MTHRSDGLARTLTDAHLTNAPQATIGIPEGVYGRRKMTLPICAAGAGGSIGTTTHRLHSQLN